MRCARKRPSRNKAMAKNPSTRAPVGTIVLLMLAALLYAAMLGCIADAPDADAFGQAIVLLYAAFLGVVLWLVLAALLLIAAARGRMPLWATLAMVVLWPLSAVAIFMAGDAYSRGDPSAIWVLAFLPPLFALYALWARRHHERGVCRRHRHPRGDAHGHGDARRAARSGTRRPPCRSGQGSGGADGEGASGGARPPGGPAREPRPGLGPRGLPHLSVERGLRRAGAGRHPAAEEPAGRRGAAAAAGPHRRSARPMELRRRAHGRALPGLWRRPRRRCRQRHQGAVGLSQRRHRPRTAANQHEVADRQPLRPQPAARPARGQRARRRRFRPHDPIRR